MTDAERAEAEVIAAVAGIVGRAVAAERERCRQMFVEIGRLTRGVGRAEAGISGPGAGLALRGIKNIVEAETGLAFEEYT